VRRTGKRVAITCIAVAAALIAATLPLRAATGVQSADPWWFVDDYTSLAYVDAAATSAVVNIAGSGTVVLPTLPAAVAFDPAAAVGIIASAAGAQAWAFNGAATVRAPQFDLAGTGYVGAAWIGGKGNQLAAATRAQVILAAWNGAGWTQIAALDTSGVRAVAEGAPASGSAASILVGTARGFEVAEYRDGSLILDPAAGVDDLADARGIASAAGGELVAVWHGTAVSVYGWDGHAYREAPTWEAPPGSQAIASVAWFRDGNGYWVLTADGALNAFGFDGSFVVRVPGLSTRLSGPVAALGTGWRQGDVAALVADGWRYEDGSPLATDGGRSVTGLRLPIYGPSAQLQSTILSVSHPVEEIQVDADTVQLPPGTAIAYSVSTDGGTTWTSVPPCLNATAPVSQCTADNTAVPPGSAVVYRLTLSSANPWVTPVVDATDLLEIATERQAVDGARAILIR
jgi:hypothetical protein